MFFNGDIEKLTLENTDYRRVIFTSKYSQLVLMSIPKNEDIEMEIHPHVDQFFRFEKGLGKIIVGKFGEKSFTVKDGSGVIIPCNTYHRVINIGDEDLKLYSIYSPPNHPKDKIEAKKSEKIQISQKNLIEMLNLF